MRIKSNKNLYHCQYKMTKGKCTVVEVAINQPTWWGGVRRKVVHQQDVSGMCAGKEKLEDFRRAVRAYEAKLEMETRDRELEDTIYPLDIV